jgi:hypothetical protein
VVDGTTVKNRPTLVKTQPVVQLAWLGLGGKESSALQERGEEDANVTCEGGKRERERERARKRGRQRERERARAREKEGEREREREREREKAFFLWSAVTVL